MNLPPGVKFTTNMHPVRFDAAALKPARKRRRIRTPQDIAKEAAWHQEQAALPGVYIAGLRVSNPLNSRKDWRIVSRASKLARKRTYLECVGRISRELPIRITMTRHGPRKMDEGCGLNASLKAVRDGVADWLGVKDNDPRIEWVYRQQVGRWYGVRVQAEGGGE